MQQQLVGFLGRGLAVIPGHADAQIGRNELTFERFDLTQHGMTDIDGVGPGALGDGQGDGRLLAAAVAKEGIGRRIGAAVGDRGHIAHEDRPPGLGAQHHRAHILGVAQEITDLDQHRLVAVDQPPGLVGAIGRRQGVDDIRAGETPGGELLRVELHPELTVGATDDARLSDLGHALDRRLDLHRDPAQGQVIVVGAVQGQGQDRHIVDGARLDQGWGDAGRNAVKIGLKLLIQLHQAALDILAHLEADDGHGLTGHSGGIDVLDALDLPQQLLHRPHHPFLDLFGRGPGHADHDIDHRHLDLGLFFTRQQQHRHQPQQHTGDDQQRGEFCIDERLGDAAGWAKMHDVLVRSGVQRTETGWPS